MDCNTAQRLLNSGLAPGTNDPTRSQLGFHLSHCAVCRAYQRRDEPLLATLLDALPAASAPPSPAPRRRPRRLIWLGLAGACLAVLLWAVVPSVMAVLTIRNNLAAMRTVEEGKSFLDEEDAACCVPTVGGAVASADRPASAPVAPRPAFDAVGEGADAACCIPTRSVVPADRPIPIDRPSPQFLAPHAAVVPTAVGADAGPTAVGADAACCVPTASAAFAPSADQLPPNPDRLTILLLGIDRRPDEGGPSRTDAIAVVHIDLLRQRVAILSLPRDLIVAIPEVGNARINSAAVYGGPELARRTVENLLQLPIDEVVEVDFMGFIAAVDALGGVMVNVEQPIYDASYPTMDYGYQTIAFEAGLQYMDGATALIYGRTRHMDSDFERMQRQQTLLIAMLEQVRGQNMVQQLQSIATLTGALRGYVYTTMAEERMISLAWALRNLDPASVERYTLTRGQTTSGVLAADPYALFAAPEIIEALAQQLIGE